jgi:hypothetical protein
MLSLHCDMLYDIVPLLCDAGKALLDDAVPVLCDAVKNGYPNVSSKMFSGLRSR